MKTRSEKEITGIWLPRKRSGSLLLQFYLQYRLGIFFSAMIYFKTRLTIWTVIAVVGCLPACKSMVSLIMIFRAKPVAPQVYEEISEHAGRILMSYEMYMTF